MKTQHRELHNGKWFELSTVEQLANIGSDVLRAINWKERGNMENAKMAFERALELFDLSLKDDQNQGRRKEIARAREQFVDYFAGDNEYMSTRDQFQQYFDQFAYLARLRHIQKR